MCIIKYKSYEHGYASHKPVSMNAYVNCFGADQPACLCILIRVIVVFCPVSMTFLLYSGL